MKEVKQEVKSQDNQKTEMPKIKISKVDEMFTLVKTDDGVKIAIGNYQISRHLFKSFQAAEDYLRQKPYEILINATCLFTNLQIKENEKKNPKTDK